MDNSDNFQYRSRELSDKEPIIIAEALLDCDCMKTQRGMVLDLLDRAFPGIAHRTQGGSNDLTEVVAIVLTCEKWPGSLEKLAEIVISLEGNTTPSQRLHAVMRKLFISLVSDVQPVDVPKDADNNLCQFWII